MQSTDIYVLSLFIECIPFQNAREPQARGVAAERSPATPAHRPPLTQGHQHHVRHHRLRHRQVQPDPLPHHLLLLPADVLGHLRPPLRYCGRGPGPPSEGLVLYPQNFHIGKFVLQLCTVHNAYTVDKVYR